ncbi:hypothetical protein ZRA01_12090 [Zoogloea ramigera]|uniref:Uncharacterized protein n=1 Tax=Zoogloea ramigera TaxID=350 RepID=A0A4Y4CS47_ZOORA|nr:hypothetical protein ZRA01_12090 [Zoogloea ramigera]
MAVVSVVRLDSRRRLRRAACPDRARAISPGTAGKLPEDGKPPIVGAACSPHPDGRQRLILCRVQGGWIESEGAAGHPMGKALPARKTIDAPHAQAINTALK